MLLYLGFRNGDDVIPIGSFQKLLKIIILIINNITRSVRTNKLFI